MAIFVQLIVSPTSGRGRGVRRLSAIEAALRSARVELASTVTRSLSHARELAAVAIQGGCLPVAVGGDGLVNAIVGAIVEEGKGVLGIIPAGTGNDFARALGISSESTAIDVVKAAAAGTATTRRVDLGVVGTTPYTCIASVGFDSDVIEIADRCRIVRGSLKYPYATIRALFGWRPAKFSIETDGALSELSGYSVAVANGSMYGKGMRLAPGACIDDGFLDVVAIRDIGRLRFLSQAPKVFRGTHVNNAEVSVWQARSVTMTADRPFQVYADGEPMGTVPVEIGVMHSALDVVVPEAKCS